MEPMNDKSWISIGNRVDPRYVHGVIMFLDFAESNSRLPDGLIHCPCKKCKNIRMYQRQEVGRHLIMNGIMPDYTNWNKHGERRQRPVLDASTSTGVGVDILRDAFRIGSENNVEHVRESVGPNQDAQKFDDLLNEVEKPLYEGYTEFTVFSSNTVNVEDVEYSTSNAPKRIPMDVFMKAYTPKDPAKDPQTVRMLEEISILRQSQSSQGSKVASSMEPILAQVLGEGKGKYVRGLNGRHTRKDVATSEGRYMMQQIAKLVKENQTLTSTVQQLQTQLDDINATVGFMKDFLSSICGKLNMPVPNIPMRSSTVDERRSAADEA